MRIIQRCITNVAIRSSKSSATLNVRSSLARVLTTFILLPILLQTNMAMAEDYAYANIAYIVVNSKAGIEAKKHLIQIADNYQKAKLAKEDKLLSLKKIFDDSSVSNKKRDTIKKEYDDIKILYDNSLKDANAQLHEMDDKITSYILSGINSITQQYGKVFGYTAIFDINKNNKLVNLVYADKSYHLTSPENLIEYKDLTTAILGILDSNEQYVSNIMVFCNDAVNKVKSANK